MGKNVLTTLTDDHHHDHHPDVHVVASVLTKINGGVYVYCLHLQT